jgi:hypothetical protein
MNRKTIVLTSGMLAIFFYLLHIIIGGILWKEYDPLQQPISDLTAAGSPDRNFLLSFIIIYSIVSLVFSLSFWILESRKYNKLIQGGAISYIGMSCITISYLFFPEDLPGHTQTFAGFTHILIIILIVPFTILSPLIIGIGFIKVPSWKPFGYFSVTSGILILICGGIAGLFYMNKLPYFGLVERLNMGVLQL